MTITPMSSGTPVADVSLVRVLAFVAQHLRRILLWGFVAAVSVIAVGMLLPPWFTSRTVVIAPATSASSGALAGVVARLGVGPTAPTSEIGILGLAAIARSDAVTQGLVGSLLDIPEGDTMVRRALVDEWEVGGSTEAARRAHAAKRLRKDMRISFDMEANALTIRIRARHPRVAEQMVRRTLALVDSVNIASRQRQASAERVFLESRVNEVKAELAAAEGLVAAFAIRNRQFSESPNLQLEFERLQREVASRQSVLVGLLQSAEAAPLSEVRNTPALVPVEAPTLPPLADRKYLLLKGILAALGAGVLVVVLALAGSWWRLALLEDREAAMLLARRFPVLERLSTEDR
jgi:uncharacterized protein involved in exopolysaccharide biosynthesis